MLDKLSWQGTDSLVGYLVYLKSCVNGWKSGYAIIIEDDTKKDECYVYYDSEGEEQAISNFNNKFNLAYINKHAYTISVIRKIF